MLIYQLKANIDEKALFGNIPHFIDPEFRKMLVQGMFGNNSLHSNLVLDIPFIDIRILYLKRQCYIDYGPAWSVEISIPIQTPYKHFSDCWVLKMCDFTKQTFLF